MKTFGKHPAAKHRLERMHQSPNFKDGRFFNVNPTSMNREGGSTFDTAVKFLTMKRPEDIRPSKRLPANKVDIHAVTDEAPSVVWFGHSSYLIKFKGHNVLIDPVLSGHASPFASTVKAFDGADIFGVHELPKIDLLILTHDHYDHIDYKTITQLKDRVRFIICPLGVGEHLEFWGYGPQSFAELDWWDEKKVLSDWKITATPARHFSGRSFNRNKTLWTSYVLELAQYRIFIGGDSGYDDQFKKIGEKFKSFDLALIECGQYGVNWPFIHMFPEQSAQAGFDLNAKVVMPVHWGKFVLSVHSWTEPIERFLLKARELNLNTTTPMIGEVLRLGDTLPSTKWWRGPVF